MYLDYILLTGGGILLLAALILFAFLVRSRGKSREYRQALRDEAERIDVIETMRCAQKSVSGSSPAVSATEPVYGKEAKTEKLSPLSTELVGTQTEVLRDADLASPPFNITNNSNRNPSVGSGLDLVPLKGKYELLQEIHGGGMSRIFLARHMKLGSKWIIKFVDGKNAELANEAEVLKKLNHISLPQIIDIFQSKQGTFLVERYIEGYTLDNVLRQGGHMKEGLIYRWGIELAQVLNYLHSLDVPIIHCDLKPSNIMVTYDNHLALIDFGISKRQGVSERAIGLTLRYAAPEQFQGAAVRCNAAAKRFGVLPPEHRLWKIDARTDLYSMGVILYELATGNAPNLENQSAIFHEASSGLAGIISKCLEIDPDRRYQSAKELASALESLSGNQAAMARSLTLRRVASICCGILLAAGLGATASGAYINRTETQAVVVMDPGEAVITEQQGIQILIQKTTSNGKTVILEPHQVQWSYSDDNIARLDGDRLVGLNIGETTLYGRYRNKDISLHVTVTEPVGEMTAISLRYVEGTEVSVYAGNGERDFVDESLANCSFVSPESMSARDGRLCVSDSGVIRILENGHVSSVNLEPAFLTADRILSQDGDLYVLTGPWEAEDGSYYGIIRISSSESEFLFCTEATWSIIHDLAFSPDGALWFIWENVGLGTTALHKLDPVTQDISWVMDLPDGTRAMTFGGTGALYLAVPETGAILRVGAGETEWSYFAGVEGERNFIDGAVANFYRPTSLAADGKFLYVLDYDTVRRITVAGAGAYFTDTLAGVPVADTNPETILGQGSETVLAASELASLAIDGEGRLLLGDPKNSVILQITVQS